VSQLSTIRQKSTRRSRSAFALFAVVWLNMALQPCVMALEKVDDHDCPGCPPATGEEISAHGARESGQSKAASSPCMISTAECAQIDSFSHDGRTTTVKAKDVQSDAPFDVVSSLDALSSAQVPATNYRICDSPGLPGNSPPLNILYCVYLI